MPVVDWDSFVLTEKSPMAEDFVDVSLLKRFGDKRAPQWQPGQSGRPVGLKSGPRVKYSHAFMRDFHAAWEKYGARALEVCAIEDPTGFIKVATSLLPRQIDLSVGVDATQFVTTFRQALELLGNEPPQQLSRRRSPKVIDQVAKVIEQEVIDAASD
jgi:hypothetical protein